MCSWQLAGYCMLDGMGSDLWEKLVDTHFLFIYNLTLFTKTLTIIQMTGFFIFLLLLQIFLVI